MTRIQRFVLAIIALVLASVPAFAQIKSIESDIPPQFTFPTANYNYTKLVQMIPMRDGVKLYTVIVIPKGAAHAPSCSPARPITPQPAPRAPNLPT